MQDLYALLLPLLILHVTFSVHTLRPASGVEVLSDTERASNDISSAKTPLQKILLTQKGYIQFLRWDVPVPNINEFTFCLWFLSTNLTHSHSIFSYSRNERERLVRSWISPGGETVHLEIGDQEVFKESTRIEENRWYHLCQSWESRMGRFALWIDAQIIIQGQHYATRGHVVPAGGDLVLGQEYTDFDRGLEDGIEGAVLGFNVLLASAFPSCNSRLDDIAGKRLSYDRSVPYYDAQTSYGDRSLRSPPYIVTPYIVPPFHITGKRLRVYKEDEEESRIVDGSRKEDPIGLKLVKLSYLRCHLGRASPRIGGPSMLISWSRTPVRIFGGAIVKNAQNVCAHF